MSHHNAAPSAPRIPFVYRWAWIVGVGIVLLDLLVAASDPYGYDDSATAPAVLVALGFVVLSVIGSMAHLYRHSPQTYRVVRDTANDVALAYVAYNAITHAYEHHTEHAVERALEHHDGYIDLDRL